MSIVSQTFGVAGQVGVAPRRVQMVVTDGLAAVTTPGFLTQENLLPYTVYPTDIFDMIYSFNTVTGVGIYGEFLPVISVGGSITLSVVVGQPKLSLVTMKTADVIGAYATPVQLIAAPGVGTGILITSAAIITEVSTAFATGGNAQVQYGNTNHAGGTIALSATIPAAEITAATSQVYSMAGLAATTVTATSVVTNKGIYFTNATGAYTLGTGSTVTVALQYMIVPAV